MKFGVDFGTNRTVVAAADRGNFPLISFETPEGGMADWIPSLIAVRGDERAFGWHAWEKQASEDWIVIRSIKRLLEHAGPQTILEIGDRRFELMQLLDGFARALFQAVRENQAIRIRAGEPVAALIGVPAHANSNQRFLTLETFRRAGFSVLGLLNEPSAASIEFGHKQRATKSGTETILVYDLGGGTFDASLVTLDGDVHHVLASEGIASIGGDDFDEILAEMALDAADLSQQEKEDISPAAWFRLLDECRQRKEALNPNSRRITVDLEHANPEWGTVHVPVADFYEAARPLMDETVAATEALLLPFGERGFDALYVTGGGCELPCVGRVLKEKFGRRVRRSAYTRSATAIGLAIQASQPETYKITDRLTRHFGVWRESDSGARLAFDPLLPKGLPLPDAESEPLRIQRRYTPVHNVGHLRFLECSHQRDDGTPTGEVNTWDDIRFPYDPSLADRDELGPVAVEYSAPASEQVIEECYECDSMGRISVSVTNVTAGYSRTFRIAHWTVDSTPVQRKRKSTTALARS